MTCICEKKIVYGTKVVEFFCPRCGRKVIPGIGPTEVVKPPPPPRKIDSKNHWFPLHSYAPSNSSSWNPCKANRWFYEEWQPDIPCGICTEHWKTLIKENPPIFDSAVDFFEWTWARHDDVSREHSKVVRISLEDCYKLYWPEK